MKANTPVMLMTVTGDDLEVMDECLSLQLRTLRNKVVTTWKDKEYYEKVKDLRDHVEMMLNSFGEDLDEMYEPLIQKRLALQEKLRGATR